MPRKTLGEIRAALERRGECDDESCLGWSLMATARGVEIQRCDTCCPAGITDADVRRLPLARRRIAAARKAAAFVEAAAPKCPKCDGALHLCGEYLRTCLHCDVCGWGGDPAKEPKAAKVCVKCDAPIRKPVLGPTEPERCARCGDDAGDDEPDEDEDEEAAYVRRVGELRAAVEAPIHAAIADAERHGQESEPDHEVGDLQGLVYRLAAVMTEDQIKRAMDDWRPWDADDGGGDVKSCGRCGREYTGESCPGPGYHP